jgi:hypothetical protein
MYVLLDMRSFKNTINPEAGRYDMILLKLKFRPTNLGLDQLRWLNETLEEAAREDSVEGVVILMTFPWFSGREWNVTSTFYEKEAIAAKIFELQFNR